MGTLRRFSRIRLQEIVDMLAEYGIEGPEITLACIVIALTLKWTLWLILKRKRKTQRQRAYSSQAN